MSGDQPVSSGGDINDNNGYTQLEHEIPVFSIWQTYMMKLEI